MNCWRTTQKEAAWAERVSFMFVQTGRGKEAERDWILFLRPDHDTICLMKPSVAYSDFEKLDLRIGTVVDCQIPTWSKKLLKLIVDFGEEGERTIFSGIKEFYAPEDFVGKQFPFIINLEPKKMGEEESRGMMLMADTPEKPILFSLNAVVPKGSVIR